MKRMMLGMVLAAGLGGCVAYGPYGGGYGGPVVAGPAVPVGVYYDGYYGPILHGYWGRDDHYYFERPDHRWVRANGEHFTREARRGYRHLRVERGDRRDQH